MTEITRSRDWEKLGTIIGKAFAEDPMTSWISPDPRNPIRMFRQLARHIYVPGGQSFIAGDLGAAMWLQAPAAMGLPFLPALSLGVAMIKASGLGTIFRALTVENAMLRRHPEKPHMYLFAVGVLPQARGRGLGRKLLMAMLDECDRQAMPAYLENSNPRNTSLYMGVGFKAGEPFRPARTSPELLPMWREPRN